VRQTLFYIPHEVAGVPVFGFGWLLLAWFFTSAALLIYLIRKQGWNADTKSYVPVLAMLGLAIYFVLPVLEEGSAGGPFAELRRLVTGVGLDSQAQPKGLPIRGYGMMMLLGVVSGVGIVVQRAHRMGLNPEVIYSLAFWMFVGGIIGARVFFVIQYWEQFRGETMLDTLAKILTFWEGGLVVYGSLVGALLGVLLFCRRKQLSPWMIGDLIAPGMVLGLAFGRIGCLLNGCCWGGVCELNAVSITFPPSPPYYQQLQNGSLLGLKFDRSQPGQNTIAEVKPNSFAAKFNLKPGDTIAFSKRLPSPEDLKKAKTDLGPDFQFGTARTSGEQFNLYASDLPSRSLPVHPTQIYSAISAALLCLLLWFFYPFRRRDGEVFVLMITLYPIGRFLLEWIRDDEGAQLGTTLTISQLISACLFAFGAAVWFWRASRPKGTILPRTVEAT
jgi:phosphatidylglycerol:prolipoprotein diacylglycerol transferase